MEMKSAIQQEAETGAEEIACQPDTSSIVPETESLKPTPTEVKVDLVALLCLPFDGKGKKDF